MPVGSQARLLPALDGERGGPGVAELAQNRLVVEADAVLEAAQLVRPARVVAAEVEEPQRHAIHHVAPLRVDGEVAAEDVPVGEVAAGILQDGEVRDDRRHEVHPALVDEEALIRGVAAVGQQALRPPVEHRIGLRVRLHRDEAQVEEAGEEDVDLRRAAPVAGQGPVQVRGEDHGVAVQRLFDRRERRVDDDVPIEIRDAAAIPARGEQVAQQRGLERRRELEDVVGRPHLVERAELQIGDRDELERLGDGIYGAVVVDDEHEAAGARVVPRVGAREHPCMGEVAACDDRADVHQALPRWRQRPSGRSAASSARCGRVSRMRVVARRR
ncbi:unannotated protein [freshwater metagenome]|uniref:Unannotated protein n=1 Tax=freshwater metagenome TaxID=449393 RepID=A0A6J7DY84_9ZZZZ